MVETIERLRTEKFGVIFVIWDGGIQLEERVDPQDVYFGYTIIPGGGCKNGETYEKTLKREVREEYGVVPTEFQQVGVIRTEEEWGVNFRHIFLVTAWEGELENVEDKNLHLRTSLKNAKELCIHPVSQTVLSFVEGYLSRQD